MWGGDPEEDIMRRRDSKRRASNKNSAGHGKASLRAERTASITWHTRANYVLEPPGGICLKSKWNCQQFIWLYTDYIEVRWVKISKYYESMAVTC